MQIQLPLDERVYERLKKVAAQNGIAMCDLLTQLVLNRINLEEQNEER